MSADLVGDWHCSNFHEHLDESVQKRWGALLPHDALGWVSLTSFCREVRRLQHVLVPKSIGLNDELGGVAAHDLENSAASCRDVSLHAPHVLGQGGQCTLEYICLVIHEGWCPAGQVGKIILAVNLLCISQRLVSFCMDTA
jgi:hypothetical protein